MINRQSFFIGALAGAATTAFAVYPLDMPPAIGVIVACIWGLLAIPAVWHVTAAVLIQRGQEASQRMEASAPPPMDFSVLAQDDGITDDAGNPPGRVTFESSHRAPPGWTNMVSMFGGWPQPGQPPQPPPQPPQPPQPPRNRPPETDQNGHAASQPVAQPPDNQSRNWLQDLASYPGLQGDPGPDPADRPVPWLHTTPLAAQDDDDDPDLDAPAGDQVLGPLLPRRAPTADEYPLIWTTLSGRSKNAAIIRLWKSKDDKTLNWLNLVATYYADYSHLPIWIYELLGTRDRPEDVLLRLNLPPMRAVEIAERLASCCIIQCDHCGTWQDLDPDDYEAGVATCLHCRET